MKSIFTPHSREDNLDVGTLGRDIGHKRLPNAFSLSCNRLAPTPNLYETISDFSCLNRVSSNSKLLSLLILWARIKFGIRNRVQGCNIVILCLKKALGSYSTKTCFLSVRSLCESIHVQHHLNGMVRVSFKRENFSRPTMIFVINLFNFFDWKTRNRTDVSFAICGITWALSMLLHISWFFCSDECSRQNCLTLAINFFLNFT